MTRQGLDDQSHVGTVRRAVSVERPMSGYPTLPVTATPDLWQEWISSSLASVAEQPPKRPKVHP